MLQRRERAKGTRRRARPARAAAAPRAHSRARSAQACILIAWLSLGLPGCASLGGGYRTSWSTISWTDLAKRWSARGLGALGAFALHEACHLALGAALGADIDARFEGHGLTLGFGDLSPGGHRAVAAAGNLCTGIAAEVIVDTGAHRRSNIAWGAAAFHSVNAFGYAFVEDGDAAHWRDSGGDRAGWQAVTALHASRIGAHLAWDAGAGDWLKQRLRFPGAPPVPAGQPAPDHLVRTPGDEPRSAPPPVSASPASPGPAADEERAWR